MRLYRWFNPRRKIGHRGSYISCYVPKPGPDAAEGLNVAALRALPAEDGRESTTDNPLAAIIS